jgi:HAD superfamily hydrolase (TIGR01509 family)
MTLKALLFDVDGTLADTEETHRQAFNYAFVRFGLPWEWTKPMYRKLLAVSGGRERVEHYIETLPSSGAEKAKLRALVPAIHEAKTRLYTELIGDGRCPLRPGISRLLDEAQVAGVQLAVASTTTAVNVDTLLARHLGDAGRYRFAAIACAEHVQRKKPAPDVYRLVMSMLGRRADECVAFEDSLNGLRAARSAGLFTVITPSQWTDGDDFEDADIVLPHLGDAGHPLPAHAATEIGGPWLGLKELALRHRAASDGAIA